MTVVAINVQNIYGAHIPSLNFIPGDGTALSVESSPFTHDFPVSANLYTSVFDKNGFQVSYASFLDSVGTVNVVLFPMRVSSYENLYMDSITYSTSGLVINARIRIYSNPASIGTANDVLETFNIGASEVAGLMTGYWVARV